VKITLPPLDIHLLIFFTGRMLTHISKKELGEMAKRMRATAIMPKDSSAQKKKLQPPLFKPQLRKMRKPPRGLFSK